MCLSLSVLIQLESGECVLMIMVVIIITPGIPPKTLAHTHHRYLCRDFDRPRPGYGPQKINSGHAHGDFAHILLDGFRKSSKRLRQENVVLMWWLCYSESTSAMSGSAATTTCSRSAFLSNSEWLSDKIKEFHLTIFYAITPGSSR